MMLIEPRDGIARSVSRQGRVRLVWQFTSDRGEALRPGSQRSDRAGQERDDGGF